MPEWAIYLLALAVTVLVVVASRYVARPGHPAAKGAGPGPVSTGPCMWVACHSTRCGHRQTPHDVLAPGRLMCRNCDRVRITSP